MSDIAAVLAKRHGEPPNILATLQAVQEELGYVPPDSVPKIAAALGVTDSDVAGVLSFYHDLRTEPPGRHVIRFCMGESCLATGCPAALKAVEQTAGCALGQTSKDNRFSIEKVYCLGNCALSPSMMVDGDLHARFTPETVSAILKDYA